MNTNQPIHVNSEIGTLRRLLVHSPDAGIGKIVPRKSEEWLYDDIVDIEKMRAEYKEYLKVLLWVLDPDKIRGRHTGGDFFKPSNKDAYFNSDKVMDIERLLIRILEKEATKQRLVTHICASEECSFKITNLLMELPAPQLARILISGVISDGDSDVFVFPPIPNFIFTRDIGIIINDHLLLTKPAEAAREREAIITKYIAYYELFKQDAANGDFSDRVIELQEDKSFLLDDPKKRGTVEGGDVMMVSPEHLVIGCSVRTSPSGVEKVIRQLFSRNVLSKVSVVKIPPKRDYMHIDTVFTMVKRNMWIVFGKFANKDTQTQIAATLQSHKEKAEDSNNEVVVTQFIRKPLADGHYDIETKALPSLEALLRQVCTVDYGCKEEEVDIVYCAGGRFPYDEREQWTDACNLLALKEGVVIGYDRNKETEKEFAKRGFNLMKTSTFIKQMEAGANLEEVLKGDTFLLLPSSELSRARGGSHCMSMPLLRDRV